MDQEDYEEATVVYPAETMAQVEEHFRRAWAQEDERTDVIPMETVDHLRALSIAREDDQ